MLLTKTKESQKVGETDRRREPVTPGEERGQVPRRRRIPRGAVNIPVSSENDKI